MAFPTSPKYFVVFNPPPVSMITLSFTQFFEADTLVPVTPPSLTEFANGIWYFEWTWNTATDADIVYYVDAGPILPLNERYKSGIISPRDRALDNSISSVAASVWSDDGGYNPGTKGTLVAQIGDPTDLSSAGTLFGKTLRYKEMVRGDPAGTDSGFSIADAQDNIMGGTGYGGTGVAVKTVNDNLTTVSSNLESVASDISDIKGPAFAPGIDSLHSLKQVLDIIQERTDNLPDLPVSKPDMLAALTATGEDIKGVDDWSLTDLAGSGFSGSNSLKAISDKATDIYDAIDPVAISDAIWSKDITGYATSGQAAEVLLRTLKYLANRVKVDLTANTMTVYDDDGTTPLTVFNLKDETGAPSATKPYERVP